MTTTEETAKMLGADISFTAKGILAKGFPTRRAMDKFGDQLIDMGATIWSAKFNIPYSVEYSFNHPSYHAREKAKPILRSVK